MATPEERLLSRSERLAALTDRVSDRFARQLAAILREVERNLAQIPWPEASDSILIRASDASSIRRQLRQILDRSGYRDLVTTATAVPFDQIERASRRVSMLAAGAGEPSVPIRLQALRELHRLDLFQAEGAIAGNLESAVSRAVLAGRSRPQAIRDLARSFDRSERQVSTLFDTAASVYSRETQAVESGNEPGTLFVYTGPVDTVTRPFCLRYVGRVLRRREIDRLNNQQLPNPFLTGGGYNCRHLWVEIDPNSDLARLHGRRQRMPEVRDAVRRQRAA